jgi:hypothetical protein
MRMSHYAIDGDSTQYIGLVSHISKSYRKPGEAIHHSSYQTQITTIIPVEASLQDWVDFEFKNAKDLHFSSSIPG